MASVPIAVRPAQISDAPALAAIVQEGFETYRTWAPRGWDPPPAVLQAAGIRDRLPSRGCVCLIAEEDSVAAGEVAYLPAADERGVAHLWLLFVREPWWGTGLATDLLGRAVASARDHGFASMRLQTPAEHARARAFYEREGWAPDGRPIYEPMLALTLVTYRRTLAV
jgi:GNAT superfamily N-acetyltransferase